MLGTFICEGEMLGTFVWQGRMGGGLRLESGKREEGCLGLLTGKGGAWDFGLGRGCLRLLPGKVGCLRL